MARVLWSSKKAHEDQRNIVTAVKKIQQRTKELSEVLQRSIALAKERRAALITAAVTGQIPIEDMKQN